MSSQDGHQQGAISPTSLDHVALWVADRDPLAAFLGDHLGMHEIERTDAFTLVGADARRGKLTLFATDGPREPGVLARVVLRVSDIERAVTRLPDGLRLDRDAGGLVRFETPEGLGMGLVEVADPGVEYDIDHVALRVPEPRRTRAGLARLGFATDGERLRVADKHVVLEPGGAVKTDRPLLNHLALLVDSARAVNAEAEARGLEIADFVDAENTVAVFVWGPDGIKLEYVEHKPSFSLV